ncbi:ATP-binding cassette domain-containing protein [Actinomadura rugatobispora]|uniref:ATP-binding cassette domain-containing protein n=1 Tax=Actinomadura rugatobispora TaxID=1994 RepID=A0ABW1A8G5_9ACTN
MGVNVIEVSGAGVCFGGRDAVRDVSFGVAEGEVCALLGPPGAGKTTLLEIASGMRRPTSGRVRVRGADPYEDRAGLRTGAVWREGGLFPGLTVAEVVDTWRRWTLDPLPGDEALRLVGLGGCEGVPFERLTPCAQRLLDLALALVGRSDVLFLDEPSAGLDVASSRHVGSVLRGLAEDGVTILLATRDPYEAWCADRVGILDRGRLVPGGDPAWPRRAA